MQELVMIKGQNNILFPATEEDAQKLSHYKLGRGVRLKATQISEPNLKFLRKMFALTSLCYEYFQERLDTGLEYKGRMVKPNIELFRHQLTILAGHFTVSHSLGGGCEPVADSWSFANASDEKREKIYSGMIQAAIDNVYSGAMSEDQLRGAVEQILAFDR